MQRVCAFIFCVLVSASAPAEVLSLTLGLDVNSPYGISEPWATIRAGLLRLDYVDSVAELPDRKAATGEVRTKKGCVPDVAALAKSVSDLGAGAALRGVEAIVRGSVFRDGDQLVLKVSNTGESLRLAPLTKPVQRGLQPDDSERSAFGALASRLDREASEVRITGPLRARVAPGGLQTIEVRKFDFPGRNLNQTN